MRLLRRSAIVTIDWKHIARCIPMEGSDQFQIEWNQEIVDANAIDKAKVIIAFQGAAKSPTRIHWSV